MESALDAPLEKPSVLRTLIQLSLICLYLVAGGAIGWVTYSVFNYTIAMAISLGGLTALGCGMIHLALAQRGGTLPVHEKRWIKTELQALKDTQSHTVEEIETIKTSLFEDAQAREAAIVGELQQLAVMIAKFAEKTDRKLAAAQSQTALLSGGHHQARPRTDQSLLHAVRSAIEDNRVDLHVQPIVTLPQRRVVYYEGYSRLRDTSGAVIMPGEFLRVAEPTGLVGEIDNMLLLRCVQIARRMIKQDRRTVIFCNISPTSLADETFFGQFISFLKENRDLSGAIVFEIGREAFENLPIAAERNLGRLFDLGYRFSIDRCETIDLDLRKLERMGVRDVKIAGDTLVRQIQREDARPVTGLERSFEAHDVTTLFARYGIELIADRVESERTVVELLELDVAHGQGNLFGAPRPVKETQLSPQGPETPEQLRRTA